MMYVSMSVQLVRYFVVSCTLDKSFIILIICYSLIRVRADAVSDSESS